MKKVLCITMIWAMTMLFAASVAMAESADSMATDQETLETAQWEFAAPTKDENYEYEEVWDNQGKVIADKPEHEQIDIVDRTPDPLEGWNRFWFSFNDAAYFYFLKPVAQGYSWILPEAPRQWVDNFFHNLLFPVRFVSCLLQGKFRSAGVEFSRFVANTAFGLGGFADVTKDKKPVLPTPTGEEDLGQTFGAWGIGNGMYLVWPFIGPSTARDTVGYVGDTFLTPWTYLNPWWASLSVSAYEKLNHLSLNMGEYETLIEGAIDPYVVMRSAYLRIRYDQVQK